MKHILFPTDLSEATGKALKLTFDFAKNHGARLTVLYTYISTTSPRRPLIDEGNLRLQRSSELKEFVRQYIDNENRRAIRLRIVEGFSIRNIIEASKNEKYDLIVMTRSGKYDWVTRTFGSRTASVANAAQSPVLILPPNIEKLYMNNILVAHPASLKREQEKASHSKELLEKSINGLSIFSSPSTNNENKIHHFFLGNKLNSYSYRKVKTQLEDQILMKGSNLLVKPIYYKHLLQRILDSLYTRRIMLEMNIPVLVINQNTVNRYAGKPEKGLQFVFG